MSSQKTEHYELNQWLATDQVLRTDFNADNAKIDAALNGLNTVLSGKGNCQIWTTTYQGTGGTGVSNQNYLTFPAQPLLVCILNLNGSETMFLTQDMGGAYTLTNPPVRNQVYWEENNTVRWCLLDSTNADGQMNAANKTYRLIALLQNI